MGEIMLHPLDTRGWTELRDYGRMVGKKLIIYLDLRIKELEEKQKEKQDNETGKSEKD
jgi:hypothetical protein